LGHWGIFSGLPQREVGLMKIVRAHGFQNNESLIYDILLMYNFFERKNWRVFLVVPHRIVAL
jgi:hypothetical protein